MQGLGLNPTYGNYLKLQGKSKPEIMIRKQETLMCSWIYAQSSEILFIYALQFHIFAECFENPFSLSFVLNQKLSKTARQIKTRNNDKQTRNAHFMLLDLCISAEILFIHPLQFHIFAKCFENPFSLSSMLKCGPFAFILSLKRCRVGCSQIVKSKHLQCWNQGSKTPQDIHVTSLIQLTKSYCICPWAEVPATL